MMLEVPIDHGSEPGSYTDAFRFPPYGQAAPFDEFRRGFPVSECAAPRQLGAGEPLGSSFHVSGDTRG